METVAVACYNKSRELRAQTSSGGIYPLIAKWILEQGGVVFAVCYDKQFETVYKKITSLEELPPSYSSKYIQAKLGITFEQVKESLLENKKTLFVGIPCHCSGLLSFLGKKYDNLICVDLVCHGVPSKKIWRQYLQDICGEEQSSLTALNMRDKSSGWSRHQYSCRMDFANGNARVTLNNKIPFMKGFVSDLYLRPSCYECKFKGTERETDLTLGDYWGVWDIQPGMDDNHGTSLVLIHSEKGKKVFHRISDQVVFKKADIAKAEACNPSLIWPATKTPNRDLIFSKLKNGEDVMKTVDKITTPPLLKRALKKARNILMKR